MNRVVRSDVFAGLTRQSRSVALGYGKYTYQYRACAHT
jgi:hypothetical protein